MSACLDLLVSVTTRATTAETWHALMTEVLGFTRYGAYGGDSAPG
jgi:hypothetical protein